jgi:PAS domain S-box-containing protein
VHSFFVFTFQTATRRAFGWLFVFATIWAVGLHGFRATCAGAPSKQLTTADQLRHLTAEQADQHYPVKLRGVVTFFDESLFSRFIQDETAGIYLRESTNTPVLIPGQIVEVEGVTSPGEYAPLVEPLKVHIVGKATLPAAKRTSFDELASGQEDSQLVEVVGIVRSIQPEEATLYQRLEIATGGGRLTVYAMPSSVTNMEELVDSTVRVRGVCSTVFNRQRQLFAIRLMIPRAEDLVIEKPAPREPFAGPVQSIGSLLQFTPQGTYGHRVQVAGTVICQQAGRTLYIQNDRDGLFVQTRQKNPLNVGDLVEVLGFPAQGEYTPLLQDAIFRQIGSGQEPRPDLITADEALRGTNDCRLVRIEAKLLNRAQHSREQFLVLESGDFIFHAYQERADAADAFASLQDGSKLSVTGVCLIEPGKWQAGENWRAKSFHLLLRSPADVTVLQAPPWWTLRRLLWIMGLLGLGVLGASVWVGVLRRRVQQQTEIIRQKLQVEATLKERYVDLFENANDMVYTHDLQGRITSINEAGEHLLQRPRKEILSKNILELLLPEQKPAAQQWLDQVLKDAAPPTVEWDFAAPSGQPIKVEISTRLIAQNGQQAEVEGIARDITERKRLERELLEISNREQRRIGHDLHDGVCQQLVGISYLNESLADRLHEKGAEESAMAERIGYLLSNTLTQTRGVARGLFPVRLEENGLVSALEELCANANQLFQLACRFSCERAPDSVENGVALHLYYIVQEAIANAAKHGKAKNVTIRLERLKDRFALSVEDDGAGFTLNGKGHAGMGLRIMHYRARVIGAALEVKSRPGGGTQVACIFLPVFRETSPSPRGKYETVGK